MRLRMESRSTVPPPSTWITEEGLEITVPKYAYYQAGTGVVFSEPTWEALASKVVRHRIANGITVPPDFNEYLEDAICRHSMAACAPLVDVQPGVPRKFNVLDLVKRFLSCVQRALDIEDDVSRVMVTDEEANRRAEVCISCEWNVDVKGCYGCQGIAGLLMRVLGNRKTRFNDRLKSCGVCGCSNQAQVYVGEEVLKGCSGDLLYPERTSSLPDAPPCWKRFEEKQTEEKGQ